MTHAELRMAICDAARQAADEQFAFTRTSLPDWTKGHEDLLQQVLRFYAEVGAIEAINWLRRNGRL